MSLKPFSHKSETWITSIRAANRSHIFISHIVALRFLQVTGCFHSSRVYFNVTQTLVGQTGLIGLTMSKRHLINYFASSATFRLQIFHNIYTYIPLLIKCNLWTSIGWPSSNVITCKQYCLIFCPTQSCHILFTIFFYFKRLIIHLSHIKQT